MGFFYKVESLALAEDLPGLEEHFKNHQDFFAAAESGYAKVSILFLFRSLRL